MKDKPKTVIPEVGSTWGYNAAGKRDVRLKVCDVQGDTVRVYLWRKGRTAGGRNQPIRLSKFGDATANGLHPLAEQVSA
jgi:hypothetical protein